ncbi:hypothetical protein ARMSODRAFT_1019379 [Armillaria solidipes]|uniref:Uncharacterized protein n=1 Tax=Armillaria solidipes TaxID=1076256 RepID=A0A2H3BIP7_9AGAR|nr:hypothetical protein ARMSODRAFT_1019379 [Armillaria solidipes]
MPEDGVGWIIRELAGVRRMSYIDEGARASERFNAAMLTILNRLHIWSATFPNYLDVGTFLSLHESKALFYFGAQTVNEACHGPRESPRPGWNEPKTGFRALAKTAKFLRDIAVEKETITRFIKADGATRDIMSDEANDVKDSKLCHTDIITGTQITTRRKIVSLSCLPSSLTKRDPGE